MLCLYDIVVIDTFKHISMFNLNTRSRTKMMKYEQHVITGQRAPVKM